MESMHEKGVRQRRFGLNQRIDIISHLLVSESQTRRPVNHNEQRLVQLVLRYLCSAEDQRVEAIEGHSQST